MVLGFCLNINAKDPLDIGLWQIAACNKMGFSYVELPLERIVELSESGFSHLRKKIICSTIPALVCNCFFPENIRLIGIDYKQSIFQGYVQKAIERASLLGIRKIVFGSPGSRNVPTGLSIQQAFEQLLSRLRFIGNVAAAHNIEIELEHLNRSECNIINTFEESVKIVQYLNYPNIKSIFEYYHFCMSGEKKELIRRYDRWIGHIHFSCIPDRHMPSLNDVQCLRDDLYLIRNCMYDDTFSLEAQMSISNMESNAYMSAVGLMKKILS